MGDIWAVRASLITTLDAAAQWRLTAKPGAGALAAVPGIEVVQTVNTGTTAGNIRGDENAMLDPNADVTASFSLECCRRQRRASGRRVTHAGQSKCRLRPAGTTRAVVVDGACRRRLTSAGGQGFEASTAGRFSTASRSAICYRCRHYCGKYARSQLIAAESVEEASAK